MRLFQLIMFFVFISVAGCADDTDTRQSKGTGQYIETPTELSSLLPDGGVSAIEFDQWTIIEMKRSDSSTELGYRHIIIEADEEGHLIFESRAFRDVPGGLYVFRRVVYGPDHKLISVLGRTYEAGEVFYSFTASVSGDELIGIEINNILSHKKSEIRIPIDRFTSTIQGHLLPLVYAYHIRHNHQAYSYRLASFTRDYDRDPKECTVEEISVDPKRWNSQDYQAHLIRKKTVFKSYDAQPMSYEMIDYIHVLSDGSMIEGSSDNSGIMFKEWRVTVEEVEKLFDFEPPTDEELLIR